MGVKTGSLASRGPAFAALGDVDFTAWERAAAWLEARLPDSPRRAERIHWLTVPVLLWLRREVDRAGRRPLLAGLSAPQGAGKSTLVALLVPLLETLGVRAIALSIDDFYLRREEQLRLAAANPGNRFLEHRGYPGTHDVALGARTLEALRDGRDVDLPCYDKTAHGGRGDRSEQTRPVKGRFDLVLLEGWMLGFTPVQLEGRATADRSPRAETGDRSPRAETGDRSPLAETGDRSPRAESRGDRHFDQINEHLVAYEAWHHLLDAMVCLRAEDPSFVLRWRAEAEDAARALGKPALSPEELDDYVRRFLPAYERYASTIAFARQLTLTLDADRIPCVRAAQTA